MSTLSYANVTDVNLVLKERTHMRLCLNMLIFTHNLGNWLIEADVLGCIFDFTSLINGFIVFSLNLLISGGYNAFIIGVN